MAKHSIEIKTMAFPASTPVAKGDTVEWIDKMSMAHTVTADDGSFDSGELDPGKSFSHTFDATGTVPYHCDIHPRMKGSVVVA
jgi:plastocyanin